MYIIEKPYILVPPMWPILHYVHFIYDKSYCKGKNNFENMKFMIHWQGMKYLKYILFFMANANIP
jgi:hypothetical protein